MKKKIRKTSSIPIYAVAAVCVIWGVFLPMYRAGNLIVLAVVAVAVFVLLTLLTTKTEYVEIPAPPVETGDAEIDALLRAGRAAVREMRDIASRVRSGAVATKIGLIADATNRIFNNLTDDASDYRATRRFNELYLPTVQKLLREYARYETQAAHGELVSDTMARIESALDSIDVSFEKFYDSLFKSEAMDIETDITVLQDFLKREGVGNYQLTINS
ncbi:MAG: 5-bromo-4-chloroindolyl phosphate hydrolysis family protein [Oscillospiraceae bacterium]|jgi:hypothetical protein|nr:5-bromo-4-chloroindolyl phosphate hydrolysis family protein [Oscillospiraceae bacterium]